MSSEHCCPDRVSRGFYRSLDTGEGGRSDSARPQLMSDPLPQSSVGSSWPPHGPATRSREAAPSLIRPLVLVWSARHCGAARGCWGGPRPSPFATRPDPRREEDCKGHTAAPPCDSRERPAERTRAATSVRRGVNRGSGSGRPWDPLRPHRCPVAVQRPDPPEAARPPRAGALGAVVHRRRRHRRSRRRHRGPPQRARARQLPAKQTCHERPARRRVPDSDRPRTKGHSVIPAPRTTRTQ